MYKVSSLSEHSQALHESSSFLTGFSNGHFGTQVSGLEESFSWVTLHSQIVLSAFLYSPVAQRLSHVLPLVVSTSTFA